MSALFVRSLVVGSCRQNLPAVDLTCPFANANGDAFEIDQTDRALSRVLLVPSARADGYKLNSKGTPLTAAATRTVPGSGASSIKTRSETWFAVRKCRTFDGFKNLRST